ncbi:hypothetical protein CGLO_04150 [Colletotrichum gloeosporioides Cg-14]|uniref:Uncharacterized protein n=1 Tax=Colletotrichum gloeosporioides (strain Cg-14) TaxID=1237896 RepID=T0M4Y5_COLGC|nr:hypothetical protein CGLO_04150 [Colletotrichum gloeosporioides Cg-14]
MNGLAGDLLLHFT